MATKVNINGKLVSRPGVYTLIKSGIQNSPVRLSYGVVTIVDDGIGAGWGGGEGNVAYSFETIQDFQSFVKGGPLWDLANPLFKPVPSKSIQGASKVILVQARSATSATIAYSLTNGDIELVTKDKGLNANGSVTSSILRKGYGATLTASGAKFVLKIWVGTFKGTDALNNTPYEGIYENDTTPALLVQSPEVANLTELKAWLDTDPVVLAGFTTTVVIDTGLGVIVSGDVSANPGYKLATGATELYDSTAFNAAIEVVRDMENNFFLAGKANADARHANNLALLQVINEGKYERFMIVGGGTTAAELDSVSIVAAAAYNTDKVILVHGDGLQSVRGGSKKRSSLWKAANILGRLAGLEPQVPLTFKSTALDGEANPLSEAQQEKSLDKGVLVTYTDVELGYNVVLQGINTLQNNDYLVNEDGTSGSIAVKRITAQLNKEVAIFLKRKFFGKDTEGPNRNTITEPDLVAATEGYLQSRTASSLQDDLIIRFEGVTASVTADTYYVNYSFVPNFEVNKIIVTGVILEK